MCAPLLSPQMHVKTVSLCDMQAMEALPWKIVIDDHRQPSSNAAVVDLGLGNDLVLKQGNFLVVLEGKPVQRVVQLYDSQLRLLDEHNQRRDSFGVCGSFFVSSSLCVCVCF